MASFRSTIKSHKNLNLKCELQFEKKKWIEVDGQKLSLDELFDELVKRQVKCDTLQEQNQCLAVNVEACQELIHMDMGQAIERLFEIDNTESKKLVSQIIVKAKQEAIERCREILKSFGNPHEALAKYEEELEESVNR